MTTAWPVFFAQLLKLSQEDVLRLLALAMAETLAVGKATTELAGAVTGATLNDWRPDDTFFDLLNGKDVVNALLSDVGSPAIAEGNKAEPAKVQKGIIKDIMRGENGREQNADWLPAYFRFPASAHSDRGGIAIVDRWNSVAELLPSCKVNIPSLTLLASDACLCHDRCPQ